MHCTGGGRRRDQNQASTRSEQPLAIENFLTKRAVTLGDVLREGRDEEFSDLGTGRTLAPRRSA